jgi:hypothetical protein
MTDTYADLDAALDRVVSAARAHLEAVKAAAGQPDDDAVWRAYVTLNNVSREYDQRLDEVFGEVTPWDLEEISPEEAEGRFGTITGGPGDEPERVDDPHPEVISVRQRRDYRVPSVTALLRAAEAARQAMPRSEEERGTPVGTVGEAVLELLQSGDGSLGMLDIPELDPLDGLVTVHEVSRLAGADLAGEDGEPFRLGPGDTTLGRLDERPFIEHDGADRAGNGRVEPATGV